MDTHNTDSDQDRYEATSRLNLARLRLQKAAPFLGVTDPENQRILEIEDALSTVGGRLGRAYSARPHIRSKMQLTSDWDPASDDASVFLEDFIAAYARMASDTLRGGESQESSGKKITGTAELVDGLVSELDRDGIGKRAILEEIIRRQDVAGRALDANNALNNSVKRPGPTQKIVASLVNAKLLLPRKSPYYIHNDETWVTGIVDKIE